MDVRCIITSSTDKRLLRILIWVSAVAFLVAPHSNGQEQRRPAMAGVPDTLRVSSLGFE